MKISLQFKVVDHKFKRLEIDAGELCQLVEFALEDMNLVDEDDEQHPFGDNLTRAKANPIK